MLYQTDKNEEEGVAKIILLHLLPQSVYSPNIFEVDIQSIHQLFFIGLIIQGRCFQNFVSIPLAFLQES